MISKDSNRFYQSLVPTVIEREDWGERVYDIYSRLLKDRIIFLGDAVTHDTANAIVAQLLFLDQQDSKKDINLYINSPGGSIYDGLAILDTMNYVKADIHTICVGMAASMGAILLSSGTKGKRSILPNSTVMIHQPLGGVRGQATDIEITAQEILRLKKSLTDILIKNTGQPAKKVQQQLERDYWLPAKEAVAYGLVDNIVDRHQLADVNPKKPAKKDKKTSK